VKTASITEAKNGLSALIDRVKAGESVVITDRGVPVAVLEPVTAQVDWDGRLAKLERAGAIKRGRGTPPLDLIRAQRPTPRGGADIVRIVLEERRSGW
jgi:prevent-host-death family protein